MGTRMIQLDEILGLLMRIIANHLD